MKSMRFLRQEALGALGLCLLLGAAGLAGREALAEPQAQPAA